MTLVAIIDPQFEDFPDIESEVAGGAAEFRVLRVQRRDAPGTPEDSVTLRQPTERGA